ncbi:hypothetical protein LJY25_02030 [Hymenobacter sp. BT175]|uniref:hypothetical protein n=1 Tax=Hymenobacter translucens TaxID=2886507 RepID=UPI001D0E5959|nr:hypothetical protein [Hymenobacter translucens]MCC2545208.1 hypothetical protein [Hymenobacter translucens]
MPFNQLKLPNYPIALHPCVGPGGAWSWLFGVWLLVAGLVAPHPAAASVEQVSIAPTAALQPVPEKLAAGLELTREAVLPPAEWLPGLTEPLADVPAVCPPAYRAAIWCFVPTALAGESESPGFCRSGGRLLRVSVSPNAP